MPVLVMAGWVSYLSGYYGAAQAAAPAADVKPEQDEGVDLTQVGPLYCVSNAYQACRVSPGESQTTCDAPEKSESPSSRIIINLPEKAIHLCKTLKSWGDCLESPRGKAPVYVAQGWKGAALYSAHDVRTVATEADCPELAAWPGSCRKADGSGCCPSNREMMTYGGQPTVWTTLLTEDFQAVSLSSTNVLHRGWLLQHYQFYSCSLEAEGEHLPEPTP